MGSPTVEILLSTHNGKRYLAQLLHSIGAQSYPALALLARDDGSDDGTAALLQAEGRRLQRCTLLEGHHHVGVVRGYSMLMEASTAPYVMFADQDDIWLPGKVDKTLAQMQELERRYGAHTPLLVHSDLTVVNARQQTVAPSYWAYAKLFPRRCATLNRLLVQNVVTGCTVMMNRALVEAATPLPAEALQHDWWVALVAAALGHIGIVAEPTVLYRQHGSNGLGTARFSTLGYLMNKLSTSDEADRRRRSDNLAQTQCFLRRYERRLSARQAIMIEDYCRLLQGRFMKGCYLAAKHRFFKNGLARNLIALIPKAKGRWH